MNTLSIESVKVIGDAFPHNAFTDLIFHHQKWFCAYRGASHHMSFDGKIHILISEDAEHWQEYTTLSWQGGDLRDPKFVGLPGGELVLLAGVRVAVCSNRQKRTFSVSWKLDQTASLFEGPFLCDTSEGTWRWSASADKDAIYSVGYNAKDIDGTLYKSINGEQWSVVRHPFFPETAFFRNESSIVFNQSKSEVLCLLRQDGALDEDCVGLLGVAKTPESEWQWTPLNTRIGGPKLIQLGSGEFVACYRVFDEESVEVVVARLNRKSANLETLLTLPSEGDCSYAGMVEHEGLLYISYYSSHEDNTHVYLAKLAIQ